MKRGSMLVGLLLFTFSKYAGQPAATPPPKPDVRVLATTASVQRAKQAAWQFTDEERIALRTNAASARERVATGRRSATTKTVHSASVPEQQVADSFDGKSHPELFLPFEVFRNFVALAFQEPRMREIVRNGMAEDVRNAGLPGDFWQRLEPIIAFHIADVRAERDLLASRSKLTGPDRERVVKALEVKRLDVCRSRAAALAAARSAFGRERFDHFLYEGIARNMFEVTDRLPTVEQLRQWEGGCR